jgi:hypothetical protein
MQGLRRANTPHAYSSVRLMLKIHGFHMDCGYDTHFLKDLCLDVGSNVMSRFDIKMVVEFM